jgi:hypothetical protein
MKKLVPVTVGAVLLALVLSCVLALAVYAGKGTPGGPHVTTPETGTSRGDLMGEVDGSPGMSAAHVSDMGAAHGEPDKVVVPPEPTEEPEQEPTPMPEPPKAEPTPQRSNPGPSSDAPCVPVTIQINCDGTVLVNGQQVTIDGELVVPAYGRTVTIR